jgi:hypothetical protein
MERLTAVNVQSKITPEIEKQLAEIGAKLGLKFEVGKAKLGVTGADATISIKIETVTADGKSAEQREFERLAPHFSMTSDDYGRIITLRNSHYRLIGFRPNATVNCLRATLVSTGKEYILSMEQFERYAQPSKIAA